MAKKKPTSTPPVPPPQPQAYEATLGANGSVVRGQAVTQVQAEARRQAGQDVVVCGPNLSANRSLAGAIERNANGSAKRCPPHVNAGPLALPHYQPDPRPPGGIPSMRHPTAMLSEGIMRFFSPELYIRFNSSDDEVADLANEEWEKALQEYKHHLVSIRDQMPSQVRKVAELCLHDAEVLGFQKEIQSAYGLPEPFWPGSIWSVLALVFLKQDGDIRSLFYFLWDPVREYPAREDWQFSKSRKHWLYDEVEVGSAHRGFLHRILFSDGTIVEIPFVSAITSVVTLPEADNGNRTR